MFNYPSIRSSITNMIVLFSHHVVNGLILTENSQQAGGRRDGLSMEHKKIIILINEK